MHTHMQSTYTHMNRNCVHGRTSNHGLPLSLIFDQKVKLDDRLTCMAQDSVAGIREETADEQHQTYNKIPN